MDRYFYFLFYPFDLFSTVSTLFYLAILTLGGRVFLSQQDIVLKSPLTQDELGVPIDKIMKIMPARIVIRIQITPVKSLHFDDNIKLSSDKRANTNHTNTKYKSHKYKIQITQIQITPVKSLHLDDNIKLEVARRAKQKHWLPMLIVLAHWGPHLLVC